MCFCPYVSIKCTECQWNGKELCKQAKEECENTNCADCDMYDEEGE